MVIKLFQTWPKPLELIFLWLNKQYKFLMFLQEASEKKLISVCMYQTCRVGAVVRALISHQCVPGLIQAWCHWCWLSWCMVLSSLGGFSPGALVFVLVLWKTNTSKFQFDQYRRTEKPHENQLEKMWRILQWREDMNFIFEWQEHYLTSERSLLVR